MSQASKIEWTDATWNPVTGCDRTSPGCDHCYALTLAKRLKAMGNPRYQEDGDERTSGPGFGVTLHPDKLDEPLHWRTPRRVFVNSMSDLFHPEIPNEFIAATFAVMAMASQHTFQVLTKRSKRMRELLCSTEFKMLVGNSVDLRTGSAREAVRLSGPAWPNIWLGVSVEQDAYSFRAEHLRATPAAVRFLSLEPLLGPLPSLNMVGMDWIIVGGESGPGARPMHPDWVRVLRNRCEIFRLPFFFKQWGAWGPVSGRPGQDMPEPFHSLALDGTLYAPGELAWPDGPRRAEAIAARHDRGRLTAVYPSTKKAAGRELDGRTWDEMPAVSA